MRFRFVSHLPMSLVALAFVSGQAQADIVELFGDTVTDVSKLSDGGGPKGDATSAVSVVGGAGLEKLSFQDQSSSDKPEAYHDFGNVLDGFRLDFTHSFNNAAIAGVDVISDPEIRFRIGNSGTSPTSDAKTGFALLFRHETDDSTNQIRAGQWNGSKVSSTSVSGYGDIADGTDTTISVFANNAFTDATYSHLGARTLAANTYDLFLDGAFIANYALGEDNGSNFDRDAGLGRLGFLGSSDSDTGTISVVDDIILYTGADTGLTFAAVPEPGTASLLLGGLISLGFVRRRN